MKQIIILVAAMAALACSHHGKDLTVGAPPPLDPVVTDLDLSGTPGDFVGTWRKSTCSVTVDNRTESCDVDVKIDSSAPNELYFNLMTTWTEGFGMRIQGNNLIGGMGANEGRIGERALTASYFGDTGRTFTAKLIAPNAMAFTWRTPGMTNNKTYVMRGTVVR